ncbi:ParA family protein [Paenibacillus sp. FSL H7-689]|uniref:ParA family protein n=1 Tax=Paenibacillus sp. FSL H7-689 TaxID=1227349 RepID=UPI0003E2706E|nr:ParA family protein [Paenibacillus sp. FSL H7-689]ETT46742.1 Cobyrinic acid ac-diamide synthase [Paenibacillus sp. FSL H7-689]
METDCKVISFMNMKGGVAKTTLAANIAYTLSKNFNEKVLFIDMDPQFNATQYLFSRFKKKYGEQKDFKTVVNIFSISEEEHSTVENTTSEPPFDYNSLITNLSENLHIIPGDLELIKFDFSDRGNELELRNLVTDEAIRNKYQYILIDSAPTYSFYTLATYIASDAYLMPVKPDYFSLLGTNLFEKAFTPKKRQYRLNNICLGIVFTIVEANTTIATDVEHKYRNKYPQLLFENKLLKRTSIQNGVKNHEMMLDNTETRRNITLITKEFTERVKKVNGIEKQAR